MKQYNGRWFLFGLDHVSGRLPNVALDRITAVKPGTVKFVRNETIDFDTRFRDIIGVTIPDAGVGLERIVLRFAKERFPYIMSKPIHHSQSRVPGTDCEVSIDVRPNRELRQQLFSFIPDIEVVSPAWLRAAIQEKIEENLKKYRSMQLPLEKPSINCSLSSPKVQHCFRE